MMLASTARGSAVLSCGSHVIQVAGFRLPLNARGPIVMVAAGTGLAPMRGFLQHRAALKLEGQVGPMALVFGCRKKSDLLCRLVLLVL